MAQESCCVEEPFFFQSFNMYPQKRRFSRNPRSRPLELCSSVNVCNEVAPLFLLLWFVDCSLETQTLLVFLLLPPTLLKFVITLSNAESFIVKGL